jgi:hypothetical protein
MITNGYLAVNSEKHKKTNGLDYFIHGLFVDDVMNIFICDELKMNEFMRKYSNDFDRTGGGLMKTFLGMELEQRGKTIKLHR